ncbi:hypothetical protein [Litorilituus lipolyticus]|uniref:Uncharacterized protein n=1 Tax=Litorilituus lipolyticus TaxID=2491017 RepID=A0A502KST2_9GAMM|nr:hypothetical protein [Litorilituus lipolyticus]TPH13469.1 hypothetical protein EPA86_14875 [Litorilituus lipolyticus]
MQAAEVAQERRESQTIAGDDSLWDELTLAQKFAASSLTQFGYKLAFVRDVNNQNLAVLVCNENVATISKSGEINTAPNIKLRCEE